MKKVILSFSLLLLSKIAFPQNVGIGTDIPNSSAALEIKDTSRGILIPRMTMAHRSSIIIPAEGLLLYQTDSTKGFWYFGSGQWKSISAPTNTKDIKRLQTQLYLKN